MTEQMLLKLLRKLNFDQIVVRGRNIMACCPAHEERNPSWGISIEPPHLHACFSCQFKGSLYTLLTKTYNVEGRAARLLIGDETLTLKYQRRDLLVEEEEEQALIDETELYPYTLTKRALKYLKTRGISRDLAEMFGLLDNHEADRLMFPWYMKGELVGVTGRTLIDDPAKTLPYYGTKKGNHLYMPGQGMIKSNTLVLVEGEIDAIRVYASKALDGNVGALGFGKFTDNQKKLVLNGAADEVVLFFDDDKTGLELTQAAFMGLYKYKRVRIASYKQHRKYYDEKLDPGALSLEHLREILLDKGQISSDWPII